MPKAKRTFTGIRLQIPGEKTIQLRELVLDFNGTLACDGVLLPGVGKRLRKIGRLLNITILTADTFGTARAALRSLPVRIKITRRGSDKQKFVASRTGVVAIGNGRNDIGMMKYAALGIVVLGPEGMVPELLRHASLVARDINDALDLLLYPKRLIATLRS